MSDPHRGNKRLYALDEAAVGKDEALKRWQVRLFNACIWVNLENSPPQWFLTKEYRRDPEAPPLPSLDWHEAPEWAKWRGRDFDDFGPAWCRKEPPDGGWDFIEPRPNPEWFELTRSHYQEWVNGPNEDWREESEAGHVYLAGVYEASKEDDMDEYLTGPALHRAIADAMEAGEWPEDAFEVWIDGEWCVDADWGHLVSCDHYDKPIRRKPRMRHLADMHGKRWEWPEPLRRLHPDQAYWVAFWPLSTDKPIYCGDTPTSDELTLLNEGRLFKTKTDRDQAERALIAASGGKTE